MPGGSDAAARTKESAGALCLTGYKEIPVARTSHRFQKTCPRRTLIIIVLIQWPHPYDPVWRRLLIIDRLSPADPYGLLRRLVLIHACRSPHGNRPHHSNGLLLSRPCWFGRSPCWFGRRLSRFRAFTGWFLPPPS